MVFSSTIFLFRFIPIFLFFYYITPGKYKNFILLIASLLFYGYDNNVEHPEFLIYFILVILLNYFGTMRIYRAPLDTMRKRAFWLLITVDIGGLFVFKYYDFVIGRVLGHDDMLLNTVLPLGISFYTFQLITYVVDVYRGKYKPETHLMSFAAYITMFPQLIAGPIVKFDEVRRALHRRKISAQSVEEGSCILCLGIGLKVILANNLYTMWNTTSTVGYADLSLSYAWLCAIALSMYIYFDFWGYSMMAIGLGRMMGFTIPKNFDAPYTSSSFTEFWRRWHITLGRFFKEYVYIPLGGSKVGKTRLILNLLIVWGLTGLWHGADYNFIIWGLMFFVLLMLEKLFLLKVFNKVKVVGHIYTLLLIPISWIIFTVTDLKSLGIYLGNMIGIRVAPAMTDLSVTIGLIEKYWWVLLGGLVMCTPLPHILYKKLNGTYIQTAISYVVFWAAAYMLILGLDNPFLYFRF